MVAKMKKDISFFITVSLLMLNSLLMPNLVSATNTKQGFKIKITSTETLDKNFNFKQLYEGIAKTLLNTKGQNSIYNSMDNLIALLEFAFQSNLWGTSSLPSKSTLAYLFAPKIKNVLEIRENGSISMMGINTYVCTLEFLDPHPNDYILIHLAKALDIGKKYLDPAQFLGINFDTFVNYTINTFFVREINNTLKLDFYVFKKPSEIRNFILDGFLQYVQYNPLADQIKELLCNTIYSLQNATKTYGGSASDWLFNAEVAIALLKLGEFYKNTTLSDAGQKMLSGIYGSHYYMYDNDSFGMKLRIAELLLDYNITFAEEIGKFVISLLFDTPFGLQPLVTSWIGYYNILNNGVTYLGLNFEGYNFFYDLYKTTNNATYFEILK